MAIAEDIIGTHYRYPDYFEVGREKIREFALAVALIGGGLVDVMPLLSATMPLSEANDAFALAADRSRAMKVQLAFG